MSLRIGSGIDAHPLVKGETFVLAGIPIISDFGIKAHSDGDILSHSICDALLGALALGDIGRLFPSSDADLKGISSLHLLKRVMKKLHEHHAKIVNIDVSILLENPKLASYIPSMRLKLSPILEIDASLISIKATTTDKLGFVGRSEGIGAHSVVLLEVDA